MKNTNLLLFLLGAVSFLFSCNQENLSTKTLEINGLELALQKAIQQNVQLLQEGKSLTAADIQTILDAEKEYLKMINQKENLSKNGESGNRSRFDGPRRYFRAEHFRTEQDLEDPRSGFSGNCEDSDFPYFNVQRGDGNIYRLGAFTTELTFCLRPPAPTDPSVLYKDGQGTFFMEDGHELYFEIPEGEVHLLTEPGPYQAKFNDYVFFTGGTGPYENADGYAITNSFVKFFPDASDRTDHTWYGWLLLDEG